MNCGMHTSIVLANAILCGTATIARCVVAPWVTIR